MVAKRRIARKKQAKDVDEFIGFFDSIILWCVENSRHVLIVIISTLFIIVTVAFTFFYFSRMNTQAALAYAEAERLSNLTQKISQLKHVVHSFSYSKIAKFACLHLGGILFDQQKYEESLNYFRKAYKKSPSNSLTSMLALTGAGSSLEMLGRYDDAIKEYFKIINSDSLHITEIPFLGASRCYEKLNKFEEAKKVYERYLITFPNGASRKLVEEKMRNL